MTNRRRGSKRASQPPSTDGRMAALIILDRAFRDPDDSYDRFSLCPIPEDEADERAVERFNEGDSQLRQGLEESPNGDYVAVAVMRFSAHPTKSWRSFVQRALQGLFEPAPSDSEEWEQAVLLQYLIAKAFNAGRNFGRAEMLAGRSKEKKV